MDDQFDNDLKKRIIEVFDNFEDPSADAGWLLLREKYPEEAKRRNAGWIWWSAAAAILLVFFGIAMLTNNNQDPSKKFTYKRNVRPDQQQNVTADKNQSPVKAHSTNQDNDTGFVNKNIIAKKQSIPVVKQNKAVGKNEVTPGQYFNNDQASNTQPVLANNTSAEKTIDSSHLQADKNLVKPSTVSTATTESMATNPGNVITKDPVKHKPSIWDDDRNNIQSATSAKSTDNTKRVSFGIYAATYVNYAKGSTNQLNAGVGFTSDIKISKNLKFSTGLILAQNTLNYANAPLKASGGSDLSFISVSAQHAYADVVPNAKPGFGLNSADPVFKSYNANLVGLDIPLNLKYEFNPQKSATYVSAGLSSGTFVNEVYTYNYVSPVSQQSQDASTHSNFSNFYFAKTLDVSFGVGYPLGKSNQLIIEPFLKYPLDGIGAQQIRFGAGGINFKFNFKPSGK